MTEWSVKNWPKQAAPTSTTPPVQQIKTPKRSHKDEKASASAKQFLKSLPKLPRHYCQADTNKQYLEPVFETYISLYREYERICGHDNLSYVTTLKSDI